MYGIYIDIDRCFSRFLIDQLVILLIYRHSLELEQTIIPLDMFEIRSWLLRF